MKKLVLAAVMLFAFSAHAEVDPRVQEICSAKTIKDVATCEHIISEEIDAVYVMGEQNAHLTKRQKNAKFAEFLNMEPMINLCRQAQSKPHCEMFRSVLIEEYKAGIGLY